MSLVVTMFTDSSWCPETRAGGWSVWWKTDQGMERQAGGFKQPPASALHAELGALANGVWLLDRYRPAPWMERGLIILQSDCLQALDLLARRTLPKPGPLDDMVTLVQGIAGKRRWKLDLRHVKAHVGCGDRVTVEGRRTAVNNWCDEAAKAEMRRVRDAVVAEG